MKCLLLLMFLFSFAASAQNTGPIVTTPELTPTVPTCPECPKKKCEDCPREWGHSERYRDDSFGSLMVGYQFVSTWVPGKYAGSYTQILNKDWSLELEYVTSERSVEIGDFELGKIKEERFTFFGKYYLTNSFHFSFGPYYYQYTIDTAGSLKNLANQDFDEKWDITGLGAAFAFGNRWQTKWGITYGFDWVRMNYPLYTAWLNKDTGEVEEASRKDANRSFELLRKIPSFAFFTVNLGYTF